MDHPLSFIIAGLVCIGTALYITLPLRRRKSPQPVAGSAVSQDRASLLERRDALLRDLKELEFDHNTSKIGDDDYNEMRAATAESASSVLQMLETGSTPALASRRRRLEIEAEVEVLIARARRNLMPDAPVQTNGAAAEAVLNAAFQAGGWACSACGRVMGKHDRFCASCGANRPE